MGICCPANVPINHQGGWSIVIEKVAGEVTTCAAAALAAALAAAPALLAPQFGDIGRVQDAYIAATAEELARRFALRQPDWTVGEDRHLRRPWFATPLAALRAVLLLESPPAFRARNLFVSENALSRA